MAWAPRSASASSGVLTSRSFSSQRFLCGRARWTRTSRREPSGNASTSWRYRRSRSGKSVSGYSFTSPAMPNGPTSSPTIRPSVGGGVSELPDDVIFRQDLGAGHLLQQVIAHLDVHLSLDHAADELGPHFQRLIFLEALFQLFLQVAVLPLLGIQLLPERHRPVQVGPLQLQHYPPGLHLELVLRLVHPLDRLIDLGDQRLFQARRHDRLQDDLTVQYHDPPFMV